MVDIAEDHTTLSVRSRVDPSENVPVAVKCTVKPAGTLGAAGATSIDASVALVTVNVVDPAMPAELAPMSVEPCATGVARPLDPAAFEMLAMAGIVECQTARLVTSKVDPSENVPVAVNWSV